MMAGIKRDRISMTLLFVLMVIVVVALAFYVLGLFRGEEQALAPIVPEQAPTPGPAPPTEPTDITSEDAPPSRR